MHVENASHPHISIYSYVNGVKITNITPKKLASALDIPYHSNAVQLATDWPSDLYGDILDTCIEVNDKDNPFLVSSLDETCKFLYSLTRNILIPKIGDRTNVPRHYMHLFWALIHRRPVNLTTIICEEWIRTYNSSGKGIAYASVLMAYLESKKVPMPDSSIHVKGLTIKGSKPDRKGKAKATDDTSMDIDEEAAQAQAQDSDDEMQAEQWEAYDPYLWEHVESGQSSSHTEVPPGSTVAGIRFLHGKIKEVDAKVDALSKQVGDLHFGLTQQINHRYDDMHSLLDSQILEIRSHIDTNFHLMEDRMLQCFNHIPGYTGPTPTPPPSPPPEGNL